MKEVFKKNEWLLSYLPMFIFAEPTEAQVKEMKEAGVIEQVGQVPPMLQSMMKLPALPIPIYVQLEFCYEIVQKGSDRLSLYSNSLIQELEQDTEERNKRLDSLYIVYTDSPLHQKIKEIGNKPFWLSRYLCIDNEKRSFAIEGSHKDESKAKVQASYLTGIYEGIGTPSEYGLKIKDLIKEYGEVTFFNPNTKEV